MENTEVAPRGDHSLAELRSMMAGETPAAATPTGGEEKETPAGEASASTETDPNSGADAKEGNEANGQQRGADGKFAAKDDDGTPAGVQKRIDKAVKAQREAERRAADAERKLAESQGSRPAGDGKPAAETNAQKPAETKAKPKLEDFQSYEEYNEALVDWKVEQREIAKAQSDRVDREKSEVAKINAAHADRVTAAREAHDDFDEKLQAAKGINISDAAMRALVESDHSGELLYHLCSNLDEAKRIAALSPTRQVAELGKLETRFEAKPETKPAPEKKPLPRPPAGVGGGSGAAKELELHDPKLPLSDFKKRVSALRSR